MTFSGIRHHGHHIHGDHGVEALVGKGERPCIHLMEAGDIVEPLPLDPRLRLAEHLRRKIDAGDGEMLLIAGQRQSGADADLEHPALAAG